MNRRTLQMFFVIPLLVFALAACGGTTQTPGGPPGGPPAGGKAIAVAAGTAHSLALIENGTVVAWGNNAKGTLGDGTDVSRFTPVQVKGLKDVVGVSAGYYHSIAVTSGGEVWAWGDNGAGQLGVSAPGSSSVPVKVAVANATDVIAAGDTSFAIDTDGKVWAWGVNAYGQLGDGSTGGRSTPTVIAALSGVRITQLAASPNFVLAQDADGHVWSWGSRTGYVLGTGDWDGSQLTPAIVTNLDAFNVSRLAAGYSHAMALLDDQTAIGWGGNHQGQLGSAPGAPPTVHVPTALSNAGLVALDQVAAGNGLSLAVTATGEVLTWGANTYGQLGEDVGLDNRYAPTSVKDKVGTPIGGIKAVAASLANGHVLALRADGSVLSWGANAYGQLGDGSTTDRDRPVQVAGLG